MRSIFGIFQRKEGEISPVLDDFFFCDNKSGFVITADACLDSKDCLYDALGIAYTEERRNIPDTHLILRAYRRWGHDCPLHLLGDFAFAIWNPHRRQIFCARDHIGAKPFCYHLTADLFIFAGDINAILSLSNISKQLNDPYIAANLLGYSYAYPEQSFYQEIRRLPPGHTITINANDVALRRYWKPENSPDVRFKRDGDYIEAFQEIYSQVIRDSLSTGNPVGVHLTGGLDSSSIAVSAARELKRQGRLPPQAFCWHPPPQDVPQPKSEHALIQAVCDQEDLTPHFLPPSADTVLALTRRDVTRQPTSELIHEMTVQQHAAKLGVRVLLSGWGGDEGISFNGRGYYQGLVLQKHWRQLYQLARNRSAHPWLFIFTQACLPLVYPDTRRLIKCMRRKKWPSRYPSMIHADFFRQTIPPPRYTIRETSVRATQLQLLTLGHITDRIESWATEGTQHQLTYRYPLLDRRLLEFALGLPPEQYRNERWNRWFMRKAMSTILPPEICWNPSKEEPIRLQALYDAISGALDKIAYRLRERSTQPARVHYINMPRLMQHLDPNHFRANPKWGKIMPALLLLDWE